MSNTVFIDGQAGTTGLELAARLRAHDSIDLIEIDDASRKDADARRAFFERADVSVLCLPDDAAREAATLTNDCRLLDASTAHRVHDDWVYGMPELTPTSRRAIETAKRVSNPGCYPTGFILSVRPLIEAGWLAADLPLRVHAVSGYSGGGNKLIDRYTNCQDGEYLTKPYGLSLAHKHVPEMRAYSGTVSAPLFNPMVGHFYKGMLVQVPLFMRELTRRVRADDITNLLRERYTDEPFVQVFPTAPDEGVLDDGFLSPTVTNGTNGLDMMVFGHDEQVTIVTRYDNLGKGASGAAVQNLNLMLGLPETTGLA